jgi:hypothetical protein
VIEFRLFLFEAADGTRDRDILMIAPGFWFHAVVENLMTPRRRFLEIISRILMVKPSASE